MSPYAINSRGGKRVSTNDGYLEPARGRKGMLFVALFQPFSRGSLHMTSAEPEAISEIDLRMLSDERDMLRLRDGVQRLWAIVRHPAVDEIVEYVDTLVMSQGYVTQEVLTELPQGAKLEEWLLSVCGDTQHPVGTCRMGATDQHIIGIHGSGPLDRQPTLVLA